jgi:hypothetical protein
MLRIKSCLNSLSLNRSNPVVPAAYRSVPGPGYRFTRLLFSGPPGILNFNKSQVRLLLPDKIAMVLGDRSEIFFLIMIGNK